MERGITALPDTPTEGSEHRPARPRPRLATRTPWPDAEPLAFDPGTPPRYPPGMR